MSLKWQVVKFCERILEQGIFTSQNLADKQFCESKRKQPLLRRRASDTSIGGAQLAIYLL